jgi:hypothetical protein
MDDRILKKLSRPVNVAGLTSAFDTNIRVILISNVPTMEKEKQQN